MQHTATATPPALWSDGVGGHTGCERARFPVRQSLISGKKHSFTAGDIDLNRGADILETKLAPPAPSSVRQGSISRPAGVLA